MRTWTPLALTALIALAACESPAPDETGSTEEAAATDAAAIEETIRARAQEFDDAVTAKDPARIGALYADDAIIQAPGEPPATGPEPVRSDWAETFEMMPDAVGDGETESVIVAESGELAVETGRYSFGGTAPDGTAVSEEGKYLTVWRLQDDGTWKIVAESYSSNAPPGGAEGAGEAGPEAGTEEGTAPGE